MSISKGARHQPHHRGTRKARATAFISGAGIALPVLGCAWTVYANIFASGIYPSVAAVPFEPVRRVAPVTTFASRFEPVAAAATVVPKTVAANTPAPAIVAAPAAVAAVKVAAAAPKKKPNQYVALLDANYSLGMEPDTFKQSVPETTAALSATAPMIVAKSATPAAMTPPPPVQLALNVPTPPQRPSLARAPQTSRGLFGHESLVQRAKAAIMASAAARKSSIFEKLFGTSPSEAPVLAYASADGGVAGDGRDSTFTASPDDRVTAVYDISAKTVYMPNGSKLEAHSGLGDKLDNPRFANVRMRGVTPPHVYDLTPREALFHGVAALRLNPIGGEDVIFGRTGLLAHTYMLGPNGDSNGCVSFKNYDAFLKAFRNGEVKKLVVVASLN